MIYDFGKDVTATVDEGDCVNATQIATNVKVTLRYMGKTHLACESKDEMGCSPINWNAKDIVKTDYENGFYKIVFNGTETYWVYSTAQSILINFPLENRGIVVK